MSKWYELYVKAPEGNGYTTPEDMKRIDEHLTSQTLASFNVPVFGDRLPVQEPDGTWEVRVYDEGALRYVRYILTGHYGLEIVREEEHDK